MYIGRHSASAWSFGKENRSDNKSIQNPGPGQYKSSLYDKKRAPTWRIGSANRSISYRGNNPGPGNYQIKSKLGDAPKYSIRPKTGTEFDNKHSGEYPGPSSYNPSVYKNKDYKYSMRIRPMTPNSKMNNPGPGNYNIRDDNKDIFRISAYKFGGETKHRDPDFTYLKSPGPGNYKYQKDPIIKQAPKFSFGKELRGDSKRPKTPGPGTYEYKKVMGKDGPAIHMSMVKPDQAILNKFPGPGTYESHMKDKKKAPEYRIGSSKRQIVDNETKQKPGPGQYDPMLKHRPKSPEWRIGSEERGDMTSNNKKYVPGPGNYENKSSVGGGPKVSEYNYSIIYV